MKSKYDMSKMESVRNPYAAKLQQQQPSSRVMKKRAEETDATESEASDSVASETVASETASPESEQSSLTQLREAVRLRKLGKGKARKKK